MRPWRPIQRLPAAASPSPIVAQSIGVAEDASTCRRAVGTESPYHASPVTRILFIYNSNVDFFMDKCDVT